MKQWEYQTAFWNGEDIVELGGVGNDLEYQDLQTFFDEQGEQGWELSALLESGMDGTWLIFKRRKRKELDLQPELGFGDGVDQQQ